MANLLPSGRLCSVYVFIAIVVASTFGCNNNQFSLKIRKISNCAGNVPSLVTLENFTATLDANCQLVPSGCVIFKAFSSAKVSYKLKKDQLIPMQKKFEGCEGNSTANFVKKSFNAVFPRCPAADGKVCGSSLPPLSISEYLPLGAGRYVGNITLDHGSLTSCFRVDVHVIKADDGPVGKR